MKNILLLFLLLSVGATAQVTDKMPGVNCDNVINDKLVGASNRSPSPCEIEFDRKVRMDLQNAFGKLFREWSVGDWQLSDTMITELKGVSRSSEKNFFWLSREIQLDSKPNSSLYQSWAKKYTAAMDDFQTHPGEASAQKFKEIYYKANSDLHIRIHIIVNSHSSDILFFKGGEKPFRIEGAAYAVKGPYVAPKSGGGIDDSKDACLILFGNPKVSVHKESDGSENVSADNIFPKASHLTVQQISIRIECSEEILNQILKEIDFKALAKMIGS